MCIIFREAMQTLNIMIRDPLIQTDIRKLDTQLISIKFLAKFYGEGSEFDTGPNDTDQIVGDDRSYQRSIETVYIFQEYLCRQQRFAIVMNGVFEDRLRIVQMALVQGGPYITVKSM